ncbi:hypothetical protein CCUS01_17415 [Colletotrichum cuscutae]|uniref:Uncharacterized protein n=1 Tax=Colletotrichum cuscutae TaxID=1209917 RepID=A0AAI9V5B2_9PEZI|nr:hypothetical protein CCUS01_17415 [Colletotrichum cuscutae]
MTVLLTACHRGRPPTPDRLLLHLFDFAPALRTCQPAVPASCLQSALLSFLPPDPALAQHTPPSLYPHAQSPTPPPPPLPPPRPTVPVPLLPHPQSWITALLFYLLRSPNPPPPPPYPNYVHRAHIPCIIDLPSIELKFQLDCRLSRLSTAKFFGTQVTQHLSILSTQERPSLMSTMLSSLESRLSHAATLLLGHLSLARVRQTASDQAGKKAP